MERKEVLFSILKGKTIIKIEGLETGSDNVFFETSDGCRYHMYHSQDCCESVLIDDVCGDINDILNSTILLAEEVTSNENPEGIEKGYQESFTWTFYKIFTFKGDITIRWYGESNGWYSESVNFYEICKS